MKTYILSEKSDHIVIDSKYVEAVSLYKVFS